jgi:hypothetical protein
LLFLVIIAVLVALDAYREESSLLTAQLKGLVPDAEIVARLERGRDELEEAARSQERQVNERLRQVPGQTAARVDQRIAELQADIAEKERSRRTATEKTIALLTGEGFQEDLQTEIDIQLLTAERDALKRFKGELDARRADIRSSEREVTAAAAEVRAVCERFRSARAVRERHVQANPLLSKVPGTESWRRLGQLREEVSRRAQDCIRKGEKLAAATKHLERARAVRREDIARVESATASILGPLDDLVAARRAALDSATRQAERIQGSIRKVFLNALWILVVVTLAPVGIKAFWYWIVAPAVETRPPTRLRPQAGVPPRALSADARDLPSREKISAVSQELSIGSQEELLVQPEFLQRSAARSRKSTQWLLDWRYPFTSLAARMVALDRIRATPDESFVISSRNDPFAEVGVLELAEGEALVLQPRTLVGLVQSIEQPIRIQRRWVFSVSALITMQFRYLIFRGPGKLLVQGCRGIRVEQAGRGHSIDQGATMGFSPNLDYAPRRSETFGAYLLGTRGLFNDNFAGGPGYYVYEEMPYLGRRSGITGRGLEGLTDGVLKVFGI